MIWSQSVTVLRRWAMTIDVRFRVSFWREFRIAWRTTIRRADRSAKIYLFRGGVEMSGGFVIDENNRIFQQCSSDANALLLSTGQLQTAFSDQCVVLLRHAKDGIVHFGELRCFVNIFFRCFQVAIVDIVEDGIVKENRVLKVTSDQWLSLEKRGDLLEEQHRSIFVGWTSRLLGYLDHSHGCRHSEDRRIDRADEQWLISCRQERRMLQWIILIEPLPRAGTTDDCHFLARWNSEWQSIEDFVSFNVTKRDVVEDNRRLFRRDLQVRCFVLFLLKRESCDQHRWSSLALLSPLLRPSSTWTSSPCPSPIVSPPGRPNRESSMALTVERQDHWRQRDLRLSSNHRQCLQLLATWFLSDPNWIWHFDRN